MSHIIIILLLLFSFGCSKVGDVNHNKIKPEDSEKGIDIGIDKNNTQSKQKSAKLFIHALKLKKESPILIETILISLTEAVSDGESNLKMFSKEADQLIDIQCEIETGCYLLEKKR